MMFCRSLFTRFLPLQLIFAVECTRAEGVSWHVKHFCCSHCDKSLATQRYEMHAAAPYCCDCYDQLFGEACEACGEAIAFGGVSAGQRRWHDSPRCFRCYTCHEPLQADAFLCQRDALYCSRRCEGGQSLTAEESSPAQAPQPLPEAAADAQLGRGPQTESRPDAQLDSQTKDKSEAESRQDGFRLDGRSSLQQVPRCNSEAVVPAGRSAMRQPRLDPHHGPPSDEMLGPPVVNTAAGEQTAPSTVCCSASTNWPPDGSRRNNSSNPGRRHDGTDSGQHHDNVDSGQHHDNTDSGRRHDSADSGWHHDNTDSGRHHDNTDSGRQHDNVDSGRHHDNTNSGQCHDNTDRQRLSRQISENQPNSSAGRRGVPTSRSQTTLLDRSPLTQIDHQWHDNLSVRPSAVSSVAATNGTLSEGAAISPADYMLPPEQRVAVRSEAPQPVYADGHIVANGDIVCVLDERSGTMQAVSLPDSGAVRAVPPSDHLTRLWNKYRHRSSPASSASLTASSSAGHRDAGAGPAGRDRRRASGYISDPTSSGRRRAGRRASGYLSDPAGPAQLKASRLADDYGRSADRLVDDCFVSDSVMPERPSRQPNGYAPDSVRPAHVRENRRPSGYASDSVRPSHVRENRRPSGYASDSVRPSHVRENRRPSGYASDAVRPASRKTSGFVYDAAQQTYKAVGRCDRYNHDATRQGMAVNLPADRMKPITLHGQRYTSDVRVGSLSTVDNTGATHRHNAMAADFERCSTCSSSSDSEFDYYLDKPRVSYVSPESSLTAVNRPSYSLPAKPATQSFSKKKKKSKKCIVS